MRLPRHLFQLSTFRSEPLIAACAAIAVGMFVGTWVIGPAISHNNSDVPTLPPAQQRTYDAMMALPDPPPYRAPTPAFDMRNQPDYAALAKQKAQAEAGGSYTEGGAQDQEFAPETYTRSRSRYRVPDRHTGVQY